MKDEDRLPLLALVPPAPKPSSRRPAPPRRPRRNAVTGEDTACQLQLAMEALASALAHDDAVERGAAFLASRRRGVESFDPDDAPARDQPEEEFSAPVGRPARWRAGPDAPVPPGSKGRMDPARRAGRDGALSRRIVSVWLPRFSMERYLRHLRRMADAPPEDLPLALALEGPHGPVVHATNRAAEMAGVSAGARVVDMRALCPDLVVEFADTGGDAAALDRLVLWTRRWCPWTVSDGLATGGGAGIVMDTTGSDHLWGGEVAMLAEIEGSLGAMGITACPAVAPTRGAAWALARFGPVRANASAEGLAVATGALPVRALRLDGTTVQVLNRLGLKRVGDLAAVPRVSLARRFARAEPAANPLMRLDQLQGRLGEPVTPPEEPPRFAVQARLAEPVQDPTAHLPALAEELCKGLAETGMGLRRATVTVYRTDGEVSAVSAATSQAMRDPAHLVRLFEGKLERIDPGLGFDLITLHAGVTEGRAERQPRLGAGRAGEDDLARLVDRLAGRFGAGALSRPAPRARHVPERAEGWVPAMAGASSPAREREHTQPARPERLLDPPEEVRVLYAVPEGPPVQFVWRRLTRRIVRFDGPERIAPEWWADRPGTRLRDYYRIEDQSGLRFWLYRDGVAGDCRAGRWYGGAPRWFLHGLFA